MHDRDCFSILHANQWVFVEVKAFEYGQNEVTRVCVWGGGSLHVCILRNEHLRVCAGGAHSQLQASSFLFFTLVFGTGSLTEPGVHWFS